VLRGVQAKVLSLQRMYPCLHSEIAGEEGVALSQKFWADTSCSALCPGEVTSCLPAALWLGFWAPSYCLVLPELADLTALYGGAFGRFLWRGRWTRP
jgi:hypothetical protein